MLEGVRAGAMGRCALLALFEPLDEMLLLVRYRPMLVESPLPGPPDMTLRMLEPKLMTGVCDSSEDGKLEMYARSESRRRGSGESIEVAEPVEMAACKCGRSMTMGAVRKSRVSTSSSSVRCGRAEYCKAFIVRSTSCQ